MMIRLRISGVDLRFHFSFHLRGDKLTDMARSQSSFDLKSNVKSATEISAEITKNTVGLRTYSYLSHSGLNSSVLKLLFLCGLQSQLNEATGRNTDYMFILHLV